MTKNGICKRELNNLQKSVDMIELSLTYNKKIHNILLNLKKFICHEKYKFIKNFNCKVITHL